ncbi:hypothetical protein [Streptomyces sp. RKAG293]|uniref:hypothetical protein n=1 Tax=Streptomyces sp. RKAG293 TaxID=2893403 RepID=UPI0020342D0B|nr:hypothetical protein [Streptomyces sp. RKAG293]MCM2422825.1 hypothetical protein [Streptomyces sp. RKAG293]
MSYDIYFVTRREGRSWEETLQELEVEEEPEGECRLTAEMIATWERIVPQAQSALGEIELFETEEVRELNHDGGIQLSVFGEEVSITVPYWHSGDQAASVFSKILALAAVVERETGRTAYDPQVEQPLFGQHPQHSIALMSTVTDDLRSRYGN